MRALFLAALVLSAAVNAAGQTAEATAADASPTRVRIGLAGETVHGFLRGRSKDEVVIYTNEGRFRHVPLGDVQRFEMRTRTGTHLKRGAAIGLFVWGSVIGAASLGAFDEAGAASWQSGALLLGSTGLGAVIGHGVPRYGWRDADPRRLSGGARPPGGVTVTLRF